MALGAWGLGQAPSHLPSHLPCQQRSRGDLGPASGADLSEASPCSLLSGPQFPPLTRLGSTQLALGFDILRVVPSRFIPPDPEISQAPFWSSSLQPWPVPLYP